MGRVENFRQLVTNGKSPRLQEMRAIGLNLFELALDAVDPGACIRRHVIRQKTSLIIGQKSFSLDGIKKVILVGAGKAAAAMAAALSTLLQEIPIEGAIAIPQTLPEIPALPKSVRVFRSSHPIPDVTSQEAARTILSIVDKATSRDLVLGVISGGASALLEMPADSISLEEIKLTNSILLKCGANITEINTIRKHLSAIKGGYLARRCTHAPLVALVISDVVGDSLEVIASGPTVPDKSTFGDVMNILIKYQILPQLPKSVRERIEAGLKGMVAETPKPGEPAFEKVNTILVGSVADATRAIQEYAGQAGWRCDLLSNNIRGEARDHGKNFISNLPLLGLSPGCNIFLHSGELTVTIRGNGMGGRNQEMLLAMAENIPKIPPIVILSAGLDGIEGNSPAAGAIVDNKTLARGRTLRLDASAFLNQNDSYHYFEPLTDVIITGPTGTNVNDLTITLVWCE